MNRVRARLDEFLGCLFCYTVVTHTCAKQLCVPLCACIVGALSAGHIIESGDNANGNYVRFADGTQICWINEFFVTTPGTVTYLLGTWTFPAEYVSFPAVVSTLKSMVGTQPYFAYATEAVDGATSVLLRYLHHNNEPKTGSQYARCIAIGRWKE